MTDIAVVTMTEDRLMTRLLAHPWCYIAAAFTASAVLRAAGCALNH